MKVHKHTYIACYGELEDFANEHVGEAFKIYRITPEYVDIMQEFEQSEAEIQIECLHNILEKNYSELTDEEIAAINYAIGGIKTLDDMGILKGEQNND